MMTSGDGDGEQLRTCQEKTTHVCKGYGELAEQVAGLTPVLYFDAPSLWRCSCS